MLKKIVMKKSIIVIITSLFVTFSILAINGCYESKKVTDKTGALLWAENCNRCHNAPAPGEFNNANWDIVGTHMQVRANFTKTEVSKVIDFLKASNTN
jgi:cytochrome c1